MTTEQMRQVRADRARDGLCYSCPNPPRPDRSTCVACGEKRAARSRRYYRENRDLVLEKSRSDKARTKQRAATLLRAYGITLEQYDKMLERQGGVCAICRKTESSIHHLSGAARSLAVDHCHATGAVRGLLCHRCNRVLGILDDDKELLRSALTYLDDSIMAAGRKVLADFGLSN